MDRNFPPKNFYTRLYVSPLKGSKNQLPSLSLGLGIPPCWCVSIRSFNAIYNFKTHFMVTIIDAVQRKSKDGKIFMALVLQGGIEMVQSQTTGKFFATAKKCSISSTFDEMTAKSLIGSQINGTITRVECEPYEYLVKVTGEVLTLAHTYTYIPEDIKHQVQNQRAVGI